MYKKRVVFFIDILGFAAKVEKASKDADLMKKIVECLEKIEVYSSQNDEPNKSFFYNLIKGNGLPASDLQVLTFSDSLVASVSCDQPEAAVLLCMEIQSLQYELMKVGLLIRGAAHVGDMVHRANGIMFGPAFNYAYKLESNIAVNPRVIISKDLMHHIARLGQTTVNELLSNDTFTEFCDGPYGINTYKWIRLTMDAQTAGYPLHILNKHIADLNEEIENYRDNPNVFSKLSWHRDMVVEHIKADKNYRVMKGKIRGI
ncbi:TPA: hypothetical protein I7181_22040 [Vibrio vulnificus]|nr:hypothetical protein [Vibrio vulnificus]HAS6240113.1 hypothetical protein [Vibrio vulnificus]HAT8488880.1 hypothetical protein [Vibrio vulnificus]HAT8516342.1 hypothetical protein [Vibrio vulnificus]HDI3185951.1 hypothetical protein [Vibrio cholerae]